jgi:hypothetical protein
MVSIAITPASPVAVIPGSTNIGPTQLIATGTYSDNSTGVITNSVNWSSADTSHATVTTTGSTRGQVTGTGSTTTTVTITATDPATNVQGTTSVAIENLVVGSSYNQGFVYCLGTSGGASPCAFLPSGTNSATGAPYAGEVIAAIDLITNGSNSWQKDTANAGLVWGGNGTAIGSTAQSDTNGQSNTQAIYARLTSSSTAPSPIQANTYAAGICTIYNSGDSNNTWYLPAKNELVVIYNNRVALNTALTAAGASAEVLNTAGSGLAAGLYWSSTESSALPATLAWGLFFNGSGLTPGLGAKTNVDSIRCVRAF